MSTAEVAINGLASLPFSDLYIEPGSNGWFKYSASDRTRNLLGPDLLAETDGLRELLHSAGGTRKHFRVEWAGVELRAVRLPTAGGDVYVCRRLLAQPIPFSKLGYPPLLQAALKSKKLGQGGLILFTGGTGDGKSMSQASCLVERLSTLGETACTAEAPYEMKLQGTYGSGDHVGTCYQHEVDSEEEFGGMIRDFLRAQPDIIMLGEIKSKGAAAEAVLAALSGHIVMSTIHGTDIPSAIGRFSNMIRRADLDDAILAEAIAAVFHQSLSTRWKGNELQHTLSVSPLLVSGSDRETASRSMIRGGNFFQLKSEVERQARLCTTPGLSGTL